jgi:hypothetical protein
VTFGAHRSDWRCRCFLHERRSFARVVIRGRFRPPIMSGAFHPALFDSELRLWINAACRDWKWGEPSESYHAAVSDRLPAGLRSVLASGVESGLIVPHGWRFSLKDLAPGKGPYRWFSERRWQGGPHPNWEYFVQVAEFVRLHQLAVARNLRLSFEDDLMDLALYDGDALIVCVEVKERSDQLRRLVAGLRKQERTVDVNAPDRGIDHLRKAKYIVKHRPRFFCAVALGVRLEYRVDYPVDSAFTLIEDFVPVC